MTGEATANGSSIETVEKRILKEKNVSRMASKEIVPDVAVCIEGDEPTASLYTQQGQLPPATLLESNYLLGSLAAAHCRRALLVDFFSVIVSSLP